MTYKVKEIFGPTLQGEGLHVGVPVVFLRFSGCNKWNGRATSKPMSICNYCDTDFVGGDMLTTEQIIKQLGDLPGSIKTVVISGGEPAMQVDLDLVKELKGNGFEIHMETNGSLDLPEEVAILIDHITISPKQNNEMTKLRHTHSLKFLFPWIGHDIDPASFSDFKCDSIFLQPIENDSYEENLKGAVEIVISNPTFRLSLQTHKIIKLR